VQNPLWPAAGQSIFCTDEIETHRLRCDVANDATYPKLIPDTNGTSGTSKNRSSHCVNFLRGPYWTGKARWFPLYDISGSSKCFNPSECTVSIWQNCTSTLNIALSREKTLNCNYGITVSKKLLHGKETMLYFQICHGHWNWIVWAVRRLTPNVINSTLAEY